ncbi:MAG: DUF1553 domain-containing protein, partial [Gemmataceae bacterium]
EPLARPGSIVLCVEEGTPGAYRTQPRNLYVQVRGNYTTPGEEAPARFPSIFQMGDRTPNEFISTKPNPEKLQPNITRFGALRTSSGRKELAEWVTDPRHPLTARVIVNRVWQHHFGTGIVRSVDNFGKLGDRPTHPELLDWLAATFISDGWSLKKLHRRILLSDAYRMSGHAPADAATTDPENQYLSHFRPRRLEAEPLRDAMLAVSDQLDRTLGGTLFSNAVNQEYVGDVKYDAPRRTIYLPVIRNQVYPMLGTFDFPDPSTLCGQRAATIIAPQALYLMNNPDVQKWSQATVQRLDAAKLPDETTRIQRLVLWAYGREATPGEVTAMQRFLQKFRETNSAGKASTSSESWAALVQVVFASNEFITIR